MTVYVAVASEEVLAEETELVDLVVVVLVTAPLTSDSLEVSCLSVGLVSEYPLLTHYWVVVFQYQSIGYVGL